MTSQLGRGEWQARSIASKIILTAVIGLLWRWIWGPCWNPLETACYEGVDFGDHIQHYYGWVAYAKGDPSSVIPPLIRNWTWPVAIPLVYTDPIPLAAILLRPLAKVSGLSFQYFSILSLGSMLMAAACGYLLCKRFSRSEGLAWSLALLLGVAPTAVIRMPGHEALSLQFVVVAAITLLVLRVQSLRLWIVLFLLALGFHPYLAALLIPFALLRCLSAEIPPSMLTTGLVTHISRAIPIIRYQQHWIPRVADFSLMVATLGVAMKIYGFANTGSERAQMTGLWSANMLALIDSQDRSSVVQGLSRLDPFQWEGFSYLGLGILGLAAISLYHTAKQPTIHRASTIFPSPPLYWGFMVASFTFSLGLQFLLGDLQLMSIESFAQNTGIDRIYFLFRATGRFTWPIYYSIVIWSFLTVASSIRNHKVVALVVLVAMLEIHVPTMLLSRQTLKDHYRSGIEWRNDTSPDSLELRGLIASSNLLLNATGDPNYASDRLPYFFVQASNPTINTNYLPYIARRPQAVDDFLSSGSCQMIDFGLEAAARDSLQNPLFILPSESVDSCRSVSLDQRLDLGGGVAVYSPSNSQ